MNAGNERMDGAQSGTGVFYQVMPAVGADGKKIMKLIPVVMVNGKFMQTPVSKPQTDPAPQKPVNLNRSLALAQAVKKVVLDPSVTQQVINKVSLMNASSNHVVVNLSNSSNKHPQQQNYFVLEPSSTATAPAANEKPKFSSQLPVTVKSPALPRGQYLQIPPNAQVRTVPGAELPPGIKKQIFTSLPSSASGSGLPNVVYVSPITTVSQSTAPSSDLALKLPPEPSYKYLSGPLSQGPAKHLKLIPKAPQRPNSPLKWVVEEEDSSVPSALPPDSPTVTSEILSALAEREKATKRCSIVPKPPKLTQGKSAAGHDDALVVCNGKVFFVAKKGSSAAARKNNPFNTTVLPSSRQSRGSGAREKRRNLGIIIPDKSDEVIDLCDDDDTQEDSSQQVLSVKMPAAVHQDEDNVIFVSYIPPKPESASAQDVLHKETVPDVQSAEQQRTDSLSSLPEPKSPAGTRGDEDSGELLALRGRTLDQSDVLLCGSAEDMDADAETEHRAAPNTSDSSSGKCSQQEEDTHGTETSGNPATISSPMATSSRRSNRLLRQMFQITADVRILLQRVDESSAGPALQRPLQRASPSRLDKLSSPDLCSPSRADLRAGAEQEPSADAVTLTRCSHLNQSSNPLSAFTCNKRSESSTETSEPAMSFVEPIEEDFLSKDGNGVPGGAGPPAQPCTDGAGPPAKPCTDGAGPLLVFNAPSTNTSRGGRTRKRTMCPCCVPGSEVPAAKVSAKSWEAGRTAWEMEKTGRRGGKTRVVKKDERTPAKTSCLTAGNKQRCAASNAPASDGPTPTSTDSEVKRLERIQKLRDLLKQKEAALDLMRTSRR